jgi:hypothetical protein
MSRYGGTPEPDAEPGEYCEGCECPELGWYCRECEEAINPNVETGERANDGFCLNFYVCPKCGTVDISNNCGKDPDACRRDAAKAARNEYEEGDHD